MCACLAPRGYMPTPTGPSRVGPEPSDSHDRGCLPPGLQMTGRRNPSPLMPASTGEAWIIKATSSSRLTGMVSAGSGWQGAAQAATGPTCPLMPLLPSAASYQALDLENNTIGILVSTAVELSIGGKTLKPAGRQGTIAWCPITSLQGDPVVPHRLRLTLSALCPSGGGEARPGGLG